jgi:hypothetical protein
MADIGIASGAIVFKWITGAVGAMLVIILTFLLSQISSKFGSIDTALNEVRNRFSLTEVKIATIDEKLKQVDILSEHTRKEQVDRTGKFGTMESKLITMDMRIQQTEDRYRTISERILAINQRLDRLSELAEQNNRMQKQMFQGGMDGYSGKEIQGPVLQ